MEIKLQDGRRLFSTFARFFSDWKGSVELKKKKKHSPTYQSINPKTFVLAQKCLNMIIPSFLFTYTKPDGKSRVQYWQTETPSILKRYLDKLEKQGHKVGRWKRCQKSKSNQTSKQKKMTTHIKCWSRSFCSVPEINQ